MVPLLVFRELAGKLTLHVYGCPTHNDIFV